MCNCNLCSVQLSKWFWKYICNSPAVPQVAAAIEFQLNGNRGSCSNTYYRPEMVWNIHAFVHCNQCLNWSTATIAMFSERNPGFCFLNLGLVWFGLVLTTGYGSTTRSWKYSLAPYHQFVNHQFVNAQERLTIITLGRDGHRIRMTILTAWTTCISTGADTSGHVYCRLVVVNLYLKAMSELRLKCWNCGSTPQPEQYNHFDGHWSLLIWFHYYFLSEPQFWHFNRNSDIWSRLSKMATFDAQKSK